MNALRQKYPKEWRIWVGMKDRCRRGIPGYEDITVCDDWQDFESFINTMGPRPSTEHQIDRIDPQGDYTPKNCRWATRSTQRRNQRNNQAKQMSGYWYWYDEAQRRGINPSTFRKRIGRMGYTPRQAALTPNLGRGGTGRIPRKPVS